MPLTWTEQYFDRGVSDSSSGVGRTRGWKVPLSTPDIAAADVGAPKFDDVHPDDPNLVVSSVSFLPQGRHTVVRATYTLREFQDPTPPENEEGEDFYRLDATFEDVDVEIPIFQLVTKEFPVSEGMTQTKMVWQPVQQKAIFRHSRVVHRMTLNATVVSGAGVVAQLALSQSINEQTNKIHEIAGVKYLFKPDGLRRVSVDQYQVTYRWIFDPGVPNTLDFDASASPNMGIIGSYGFPFADDNFIIKPYSRLDTSPDGNDPTQAPVVKSSPAYVEDLDGYQTLLGVS